MKTKIIKIMSKKPEKEKISIAADILINGGLVAFPTETVYGLGANALNKNAVKKIFYAKGRPVDNPLIVHIYNKNQILEIAQNLPKKANALIKKFWPGPLTIILNKKNCIPKEVTAGLSSVAIRMPKNKIALELIKTAQIPVAAPSANLSGKPSPTSAKHVIEDLNGRIDCIINGDDSKIGIESTVIDMTKKIPIILRHGKITKKEIEKIIGGVRENKKNSNNKPKSPGMKYRHYSPDAKVIIAKDNKEIKEICNKFANKKIKELKYSNKITMAKNLFRDFRNADKKNYELIVVRKVKDGGLGDAIMDRLRKASVEKKQHL